MGAAVAYLSSRLHMQQLHVYAKEDKVGGILFLPVSLACASSLSHDVVSTAWQTNVFALLVFVGQIFVSEDQLQTFPSSRFSGRVVWWG
jgi:hypothetical protein